MGRLTYKDRLRLKELLDMKLSAPDIARDIGCNSQTIYDEMRRGGGKENYDPNLAQAVIEKNRKRFGKIHREDRIFLADRKMAEFVANLILNDGLNIKQVCDWLHTEEPVRFQCLPSSPNTIWRAIDDGLIPGVDREALERKTVVLACGNTIHLPKWATASLGLRQGDILSICIEQEKLVLKKKDIGSEDHR